MSETRVPNGTVVRYHGSLSRHHGKTMIVEDFRPGFEGDTRGYLLVYGPKMHDYVMDIRRESFTVLEDDNG